MQTKFNKTIYRSILIISFIGLNVVIIYGAASVLAFLKTGADRSTILQREIKSQNIYQPKMVWNPIENIGRAISDQELKNIEDNYLKSWYIKNIALAANNPYGVDDFYTDSARVNIFNTIQVNKKQNVLIDGTTLSHRPTLEFYSEDGMLAVITDKQVIEFKNIFKNNQLLLSELDTSAYKIVLLLEDGFWRIRHKVKIETTQTPDTLQKNPFAFVKNKSLMINNQRFTIKGVNYYPKDTPWDMFGEHFDIQTIQNDFKIIKNAKLNSIRIFIQYEDFGKEYVNSEKLNKLKKVLDCAEKEKLKVIVTLFDFYGDYRVINWTLTHRHAEKIVSTFKNHPAILAWDIKNEPDLDFESRQQENVINWLSTTINVVKKADPNHLVTIGWSNPEAAKHLANEVDFVSFHYYKPITTFEKDYYALKNTVTNKPLVLQEFGISSYKGIWNAFSGGAEKQAEYHKKMQAILKKESLAFMSWGLYDFKNIPTNVVGRLPWRKSQQKYFGFIDETNTKKPSFLYITN